MKELLAFEYRKLIRSKSLYICMIVMVVLSIAGVVINKATMNFLGTMADTGLATGTEGLGTLFSYSGLKYLVSACNGTNMVIFLAIFVTIFVCGDFTEGTIKDVVSRGFSRCQIFYAKSIIISLGSCVFAVLSMLVSFVAASIAFGVGNDFETSVIVTLLVQLLGIIAYTMMDVLLAVLFTKLGGALTLGILSPMILPLIFQPLDLLVTFLSDRNSDVSNEFFSRFTISTNMSKISDLGVEGKDLAFAATIFVAFIVLFGFLGILSIRKKEV